MDFVIDCLIFFSSSFGFFCCCQFQIFNSLSFIVINESLSYNLIFILIHSLIQFSGFFFVNF